MPTPTQTLVIGSGSWGTALASLAAQQGDCLLLCRRAQIANTIQTQGRNPDFLGETPLPARLKASADPTEALAFLQQAPTLIILGVPVKGLRHTLTEWSQRLNKANLANTPMLWSCKGFEQGTGLLPHEVLAQVAPQWPSGVISGPSFALEVAQQKPVALTVASHHADVIAATQIRLRTPYCRIYHSNDVIGVEVGGALKNIVAIACGIADGLQLGLNARAALITRGLHEITLLGTALGGQARSFAGLTGLGDLVLTATGNLSRNRQVGLWLAQGLTLTDIHDRGITAEGLRSVADTRRRAQSLGVDMPITNAVYRVIFEQLSPQEAVQQLLHRENRAE